MSTKFCSSVLFVKDIALARSFYETMLDQKVSMDHGECIAYEGGFALWDAKYAANLMFGHPFKDRDGTPHRCELYFESDDLDAVYARFIEAKMELIHPLMEQPWGQRVFRAYDLDKYIVEVGEPMAAVLERLST